MALFSLLRFSLRFVEHNWFVKVSLISPQIHMLYINEYSRIIFYSHFVWFCCYSSFKWENMGDMTKRCPYNPAMIIWSNSIKLSRTPKRKQEKTVEIFCLSGHSQASLSKSSACCWSGLGVCCFTCLLAFILLCLLWKRLIGFVSVLLWFLVVRGFLPPFFFFFVIFFQSRYFNLKCLIQI